MAGAELAGRGQEQKVPADVLGHPLLWVRPTLSPGVALGQFTLCDPQEKEATRWGSQDSRMGSHWANRQDLGFEGLSQGPWTGGQQAKSSGDGDWAVAVWGHGLEGPAGRG